jgi:hypothetical protein
MKARPVKRYPAPRYPTRSEVLKHPQLLQTHVPAAWLRHAEVVGALGALLAVNGCVENGAKPPAKTPANVQMVAPFFDHGLSRGGGGSTVDLPVFLSEAEACTIISEQLRQAGVHISRQNVEVPDFQVKQYSKPRAYEMRPGWEAQSHSPDFLKSHGLTLADFGESEVRPLCVDGLDPDKRVAFEYISEEDYYRFGGPDGHSTLRDYDFKPVIESVREQVQAGHPNTCLGVFYSPVAHPRHDYRNGQRVRVNPTEESKEILRQQVSDFIAWLKGQGVI